MKCLPILLVTVIFDASRAQEEMSNIGNIVLEQDPREQDPFYRNFYARADGMPLAAVNSVVHNVKHQSEGQFLIWDDLPSHKVRPGYTTTTKAPKITTTTVLWVRGRHRPGFQSMQSPPWHQKFSDAEGYDAGGHGGVDYEDVAPAPPRASPRGRGRRPPAPGGRGRRPPAPMAPVRVKAEELVENADGGGGGEFAGADEGTKAETGASGASGAADVGEGTAVKEVEATTVTVTTKKKALTTTHKTPTTTAKKKKKGKEDVADEGTKNEGEEKGEEGVGEGEEIDLADVKDASVHNLRSKDKDEEEVENEEEGTETTTKKGKKGKKTGKEGEDEKEGSVKKSKTKEKKKEKKKKKGKKEQKEDEEEEEEEDVEKNGELLRVEGEVRIPKAVDRDTDHKDDSHDDDEDEDDDEDVGEEEDEDVEDESTKKKKKKKSKGKKKGKKQKKHDEEDDEEEEEEDSDEEPDDVNEEGVEEEEKEKKGRKSQKKPKISCPPPQREHHHPHQNPSTIPPNQVPYPHPDAYGYTFPPTTTPSTTTTSSGYLRGGDDYHDFESMDCKEKEEENDVESEEVEKKKSKKKRRKKTKKDKRRRKKKGKGGHKTGHLGLDYLTSREKIDQNKRNRGHILDELHADQDLKKLRKTTKPADSGIDCTTAVDEFPLKCGAWKAAGFCDTNQATQFLWCRKTCLCSTAPASSTTTRGPKTE